MSICLSVCQSVCRSVRPSVRPSVHPSVLHKLKSCLSAIFDQNWDKQGSEAWNNIYELLTVVIVQNYKQKYNNQYLVQVQARTRLLFKLCLFSCVLFIIFYKLNTHFDCISASLEGGPVYWTTMWHVEFTHMAILNADHLNTGSTAPIWTKDNDIMKIESVIVKFVRRCAQLETLRITAGKKGRTLQREYLELPGS